MKVVVFSGGLGNQLFHYSFYEYLRYNVDKNLYAFYLDFGEHNGLEINRYFETNIRFSSIMYFLYRILSSLRYRLKSRILAELFVDEEKYTGKYPFFYRGVWQDKKYLNDGLIRYKDMALSVQNDTVRKEMLSCNSVAIHIRRGDYSLPVFEKRYWHLENTDYYQKSIEYVSKKYERCSFFVFSDDIEWCKTNLGLLDAYYVDWNKGNDSIYDMYLMSQAKVNIIANSTFSFWAAYLNQKAELTIYPLRWYQEGCGITNPDIFRDEWIGF